MTKQLLYPKLCITASLKRNKISSTFTAAFCLGAFSKPSCIEISTRTKTNLTRWRKHRMECGIAKAVGVCKTWYREDFKIYYRAAVQ